MELKEQPWEDHESPYSPILGRRGRQGTGTADSPSSTGSITLSVNPPKVMQEDPCTCSGASSPDLQEVIVSNSFPD